MPYSNIDLNIGSGNGLLSKPLTWTTATKSSVQFCGIHLRACSLDMLKISIIRICCKSTDLKLAQYLSGAMN